MCELNVSCRRKLTARRRGLAFLLCLLPLAGMAADNAETAELTPDSQLVQQEREYFQQQIEDLENLSGPFDPGLIEVLSDMGRWYQNLGQHEEAIEVYARALHVLRVNEGFYTEAQLRILDSLIFNYKATQNWRLADDRHRLRFRLARKLYAPGTAKYLESVAEQGNWRLQANAGNLLGRSIGQQMQEAENLQQLYQQSIAELNPGEENDGSERALTLLPIAHGQAVAAYQRSSLLLEVPTDYFEGDGERYRRRTVCYPVAGQSPGSGSGGATALSQGGGALSNTTNGSQVNRICSSERVSNPAYLASRYREQQLQLESSARQPSSNCSCWYRLWSRRAMMPGAITPASCLNWKSPMSDCSGISAATACAGIR